MNKDFERWNNEKVALNAKKTSVFFHERDIWWCHLGLNIGFEQDGTGNMFQRPVLILRTLSRWTCLVAPLTSSQDVHKMRVPVGIIDGKPNSAVISQIRVIDIRRLWSKICRLDENTFNTIRKITRELL